MSEDLPVVVCLLNNGWLGMVKQWQKLMWNRRYCGTELRNNPDFVKLAEAFGAGGMTITRPSEPGRWVQGRLRLRRAVRARHSDRPGRGHAADGAWRGEQHRWDYPQPLPLEPSRPLGSNIVNNEDKMRERSMVI